MPAIPRDVKSRDHRLSAQDWALNTVISLKGPNWDQPRLNYMGTACGHDSQVAVMGTAALIETFDDIPREMMKAGRRVELQARAARTAGHEQTAREAFYTAATLYGMAQWAIYANTDQQLALNAKKNACFDEFVALAGRRIEHVEVPFGDRTVPAYLHFPPGHDGSPLPCVVYTNGMDAYKEISVAMDGDRWLARGFAVLALDGPGTGEALCREIWYDPDTYGQLGPSAYDFLAARKDIDAANIVLYGLSFGSLWASTLATAEPRYKAVGYAMTCLEPGMASIFSTASPTFRLRFMYMSGTTSDSEVEAVMARIDPTALAPKITMPICIAAGEDDELSEISHTFAFANAVPAPKQLIVYEGEDHGLHDAMSGRLGPEPFTVVADWLVDRVRGIPFEDTYSEVDSTGRLTSQPWGDHRAYTYGVTDHLRRLVFGDDGDDHVSPATQRT